MPGSTETTGADLFVRALESYGVTHLFGNPGTTELPVMDALSRSELEYVLGLHEDVAVGMAGGYASTRRYHAHHHDEIMPVGVVNLHVAPGMAHGLGNLYGAQRTGAPIVVTAGAHSTDFQHEEPNLQGDTVEMTKQFTKWSAEVKDINALATMLRRAFRVALTPPTGPVFLALPLDVMLASTTDEPERLGAIPNAGPGDPEQVERAVDAIIEADDVVVVLGDHVAHSGPQAIDAAVDVAEASGARVYGEMTMTEVTYPTEHELWSSRVPFDESGAAEAMDADVLVFVGNVTNRGSTRFDGDVIPSGATTVHVGYDSWELGKNEPADVAVIGDPHLVMNDIARGVDEQLPTSERERRRDRIRQAGREPEPDAPVASAIEGRFSKEQLGDALSAAISDTLVVTEGLTSTRAFRERSTFEPEYLLGNKGGGLGYGLPAAIGAAVAEKESNDPRSVLGFIGDGSYLYYPNALYTAARNDLDLTVVVPDNRNYYILKENTVKILGGEKDDYDFVGMDFDPPVDIVKNAESHGVTARSVDPSDDLDAAVQWALNENGPSLLDVHIHD